MHRICTRYVVAENCGTKKKRPQFEWKGHVHDGDAIVLENHVKPFFKIVKYTNGYSVPVHIANNQFSCDPIWLAWMQLLDVPDS